MKEVHCLLDGRMTKRDGALQTLLLAHYLAEWARDTYSSMIKYQLRLLTDPHADNASLFAGSDATTMREYWRNRLPIAHIPTESNEHRSLADLLPIGLDKPFGFVRSAHNIENRLTGLVLDSSNVDSFIQSLQERSKKRRRPLHFMRYGRIQTRTPKPNTDTIFHKLPPQIVQLMKKPPKRADHRCVVSEHTLNRLEELWTGQTRSNKPSSQEGLNLWATITVTFYISHQWQLVRELSYVAVSRRALSQIGALLETKVPYIPPPTEIPTEPLETVAIQLKAVSAEHNLAASISRSSVSLPLAVIASGTSSNFDAPSTTISMAETDDVADRTSDWRTHEIALFVKDNDSLDAHEHSESYLRLSSESEIKHQGISPDPQLLSVPSLVRCKNCAVVVYGKVATASRFQKMFGQHDVPNQCVFSLQNAKIQSEQQIAQILKDSASSWAIYHTVRREWKDFKLPRNCESSGKTKLEFLPFDLNVYVAMIKWISELGCPLGPDIPLPPGVDLENVSYGHGYPVVTLPHRLVQWRWKIEDQVNSRQKQNQAEDAREGEFRISEEDFPPDCGSKSFAELTSRPLRQQAESSGRLISNPQIPPFKKRRLEIYLTESSDEDTD